MWSETNVNHDWPLIEHIWMGCLPKDIDEANQVTQLGETHQAYSNKLKVLLLAMGTFLSDGWMSHHMWPRC